MQGLGWVEGYVMPSGFGVSTISLSGFRVQGLGYRVQGSGFRVKGKGLRVSSVGFRV